MKKIILGLIGVILILSLVGCGESEEKKLPAIPQTAIDTAMQEMKKNSEVSDGYIKINGNEIVFAITVKNASISEDKAKGLADSFIRLLGSQMSINNKDMASPTKDNLGGLYDYYGIHVGIGASADNIMYQGTKVVGVDKLTW
ncbi:hypothetical protein [Clostridium estertheticum]|uniref:Uncharacterized protein n=1 Tax=Clostridium estertheticum subsp. estertheticum TaxID=1552 RepID=A0A1J0GIC9_9CLOT|nr:hypothetical protein [Clostridium estertheticum]APC41067.1 hypothetical protein A7L45_13780 [Clostridium estertheticum subsp. estertheticum]